jgi:hypothetical protein
VSLLANTHLLASRWSELAAALAFSGLAGHLLNTYLPPWSWSSQRFRVFSDFLKPAQDSPSLPFSSQLRWRGFLFSILVLALVSLPLVPVGPTRLSLAAILAGIISEISTLSLLIVLAGLSDGPSLARQRRFQILALCAGFILYWSVLTYGDIDVYRLGYLHSSGAGAGVIYMLLALATFCLLLPLRHAVLITLACLSWALGLQSSTNLWDYLLDVPSFLIYLFLFLRTILRRSRL